jgi:CheY-like chemotaxis protein
MSERVILCVDDEKLIQKSLKRQLTRKYGGQFVYEFADSPEDALELLEELHEDGLDTQLIISDWLMPGMKGDEFLVEVHKKYPHIKTIMLTGQADREAIERARKEANLNGYIQKPWDEEELFQNIEQSLGKNGPAE